MKPLSLLVLSLALAVCPGVLQSQVTPPQPPKGVNLGLTYKQGVKLSLLVLPVSGASGDSIARIISRDLDYSDRFNVFPSGSAPVVSGPLNYDLFAKLSVQGIIEASLLPTGWLRVAMHDVATKRVVNNQDFPLLPSVGTAAWRLGVHGISDQIEEWITGQRGIAQTRILYETSGRVWMIDSDGANPSPLTSSGMHAQWAPNGRAVVYSVMVPGRSPVMVLDVATGAQRALTAPGSSQDISPTVSPDGRTVAFARIGESGSDIYAVPFDGGPPRRISAGRGSDNTDPTFSPDGLRIAFTSGRTGHPEVYISDADGTNVEALTSAMYGERSWRSSPNWSSDGRLVAYQSRDQGAFQIMTINLRDQSVRGVTSEGRNDDPSWAPDSRHLVMTSTRSGVPQLWVVDAETGRARQLTRGGSARQSAWSPRLTGAP